MTLEDFFPQFYHGPKKLRLIKLWAVLIVFFLAIAGIWLHIESITEQAQFFWKGVAKFFDDIGINLLIGLIVYQTFEYIFNNIDKKYGVLRDFTYSQFIEDINKIQRGSEIQILSIFLRVFTLPVKEGTESEEDFESRKEEAIEQKRNFKEAFINACKANNRNDKKTKASILLLDPISLSAKQRTREMDESGLSIDIIDEIIETLKELTEIYKAINHQNTTKSLKMLNVKIYNRIPPCSLFQVDDHYSFSFYPRDQTMRDANHFSFYEDTPFQKLVTKTFGDVWTENSTFDLLNYLYIHLHHQGNVNPIKDIFFVDIFLERDYHDKQLIVLIPTREQAKKISAILEEQNELVFTYRNFSRVRGRKCSVEDELKCLNKKDVSNAKDFFYKLAFKKYPYDLIFGDDTSPDDFILINIELNATY